MIKKRKNPFSIEVDGEVYRNSKGTFARKGDQFVKVGAGKGKYSIKIIRIRIK